MASEVVFRGQRAFSDMTDDELAAILEAAFRAWPNHSISNVCGAQTEIARRSRKSDAALA